MTKLINNIKYVKNTKYIDMNSCSVLFKSPMDTLISSTNNTTYLKTKAYRLDYDVVMKTTNASLRNFKLKKQLQRKINECNNSPSQYSNELATLRNQLCTVILAKLKIQLWMKKILRKKTPSYEIIMNNSINDDSDLLNDDIFLCDVEI